MLDALEEVDDLARDVRAGLLSAPKDLSPWPKYFYDATGSRLFEEITAQPEYYQTRTENAILRERAREIVSRSECHELVELGSGSATKTRTLLDAMFDTAGEANEHPVRYAPLDVSESALRESGELLLEEYPQLEVSGFIGDFERSLGCLLDGKNSQKRLVAFLGGTIGNFTPDRRESFLQEIHAGLRPGEHFLLGVDLVKDTRTLEKAYDDRSGVTAQFNKNLLAVLNRRLGAEFDQDLFRHRAVYNPEESRIEMWLHSEVDQEVRVSALDLTVRFAAEEGMRTEISAKFTPESIHKMFIDAGLEPTELYTDDQSLFGMALAVKKN